MSLRNEMEKKGISADTATSNAPISAAEAGKPTPSGKANSNSESWKAQGRAIRSSMSEDQKAVEGSKQDKVAFVCALGDPARQQSRKENNANVDSFRVVGYKFRVLEDMMVPHAPLESANPLSAGAISEVPVKAGETISLNIVETGAFICRPEFAGRFTGEGEEVRLTPKFSKDRPDPMPVLCKSGQGSIKANMELIADMRGADGKNKGTPVVREEFAEKFGILYTKKSASKAASKGSKAGESTADVAAAFYKLYSSKRA